MAKGTASSGGGDLPNPSLVKQINDLLKQAKLTQSELNGLVVDHSKGQLKVIQAHREANANLELLKKSHTNLNATLRETVNTENRIALLKEASLDTQQNLTAKQKNSIEGYRSEQKEVMALNKLRESITGILEKQEGQIGYSAVAQKAANNLIEQELGLNRDLAQAYGYKGELADYVADQLTKGLSLSKIEGQQQFKNIEAYEKSIDARKGGLAAQAEGIALNNKLKSSYENLDKLLLTTIQHSNSFIVTLDDANDILEQQKANRKDLIALAQTEGAAGEGARDLLREEVGLLKMQVDLTDYTGKSAAYIVEQLSKGRDLDDIRKDAQLDILDAQEKSIGFRKKDLELQLLTKKRIHEIKESHEKIKDRIKQTLDFSKQLAQDPKALGMFAAAQVGIGLHKANHAMHELVESGMQAGEAVHVMADGISVMSVLGLSKVSGINKELISQFGTMNVLTKDQRHTIGEMATKFGLAEKEAVDLTMAISRMPGESAETAAHFKETAIQVGKTKGVMPSAIMKEMAKNAGLMATFSKGGAKGFAEAAASAKKMGIELSSVLSAAEKQLDFENSINAQMEANVLLGKSLNFDKLKEAALAGDANAILQEQTALMQQVGSLDNMNVLQKQKLAEAFGMTTEELVKFNEAQQMEQKYFGENATALDNVVGGVLKYGGAIGGFIAQNGMMILGVVQAITQLMTLRAMKIANTTATLTDTGATAANTTGTRLNTAQKQLAKSLEASGIPIKQAIVAARNADTLATSKNTGAVTGNTFATRISTMANGAWNLVKNISLGLLRISGVLWIGEKLRTIASATATGIATGAQYAWNVAKGLAITLWNSETIVTLRAALAKKGAAAAEGLYNLAVGAGNMLKKTALGMWLLEKGRIIANTIAKWANVGATAAQATANTTLAGTQTAVGTTGAAASGGLASFGAGLASLSAAAGAVPVILALGAAILMIGGGIAIAAIGLAQLVASFKELSGGQIAGALGAIVAVMAGFVGIVYAMVPAIGALAGVSAAAALPMLAFGAAILMVGAGVAIAALGMSKLVESFKGLSPEQAFAAAISIGAMAAAFYFLTPALVAVATSATVAAGPLLALGAAVLLAGTGFAIASLGISTIATSLTGLSATSQGLGLVGISLLSIAAGLGAIAFASTAAMPLIGALVGLAAVAPMLSGLGNLFGGGGEQQTATQTNTATAPAKDEKTDILIKEIKDLKAAILKMNSTPIIVQLDGRQVGDGVKRSTNTSFFT